LAGVLSAENPALSQKAPVIFSLFQLGVEKDFGLASFKKIKEERTQKAYCNADWALFKEFALPVPNDGHAYDCEKLKVRGSVNHIGASAHAAFADHPASAPRDSFLVNSPPS
jgi:hypothetical protein